MSGFFKKRADLLRSTALILMLLVPFLLYGAAAIGSGVLVYLFLGAMAAVMLLAMKTG